MQVQGFIEKANPQPGVNSTRALSTQQYTGTWDALKTIVRREGVVGLYRGTWPNYLKVVSVTMILNYQLAIIIIERNPSKFFLTLGASNINILLYI
jgi:hypothetical protein